MANLGSLSGVTPRSTRLKSEFPTLPFCVDYRTHDSVTVNQHTQYLDPETELNLAIINLVGYTCSS